MERLTFKKWFEHFKPDEEATVICVDGYTQIVGYDNDESYSKPNYYLAGEAVDKLAHYEDLEEQNLLIKLPCKVGDTVWWTTKLGVLERYVSSMDLIRINHIAIKLQPLGYDNEKYPFSTICFNDNFGETVFLTKEEAEKALAEMG